MDVQEENVCLILQQVFLLLSTSLKQREVSQNLLVQVY